MSEENQANQTAAADAERRAKELKDLGLEDPYEGWEEENPYDYMPYQVNHPKGTAKEIEAALRMRGLTLRKQLNHSLIHDPTAWTALNRPASLHSASLTLAEMLRDIPQNDREQFHELGEGFVYMPLNIMEKYLYPTLRLMQFLHRNKGERLPAGVDTMMAYSFFQQGMGPPKNRTMYDLEILRNTVSSSGDDLEDQLRNSSDAVDGLSSNLKKTLKKLETLCVLPNLYEIADMEQDAIDAKQAEIDAHFKLYKDQITLDYEAFKLQKERVIMLSHLAQRQSTENLELNLRMAQIAQNNELQLNTEVENKIIRQSIALEESFNNTLLGHRELMRITLKQMTDQITPYDVADMQRFVSVQSKALNDTYDQNALLVSQNSELRVFLSFMPIKYREYVSKLKAESNVLYRQQRKSPKVIQTNDKKSEISLVDADMSDPTVQFALRDAEYSTLIEARKQMEKGIALRSRITSDHTTKVIPKHAPPGDQPPPAFLQNVPARRSAPTAANATKEARTKTVYDRRSLTQSAQLVTDSEDQQDDQDDQYPLHPRVREYVQRTAGKEDYAPTPYSKGKGVKGKRDASPMANRHQPPYKTPKHDNPVASQRVPELARGKDGKAKIPVPPPRHASNLPQPPPADLTRGQAGIPPISEKPLMLFTRPEAIREYNLIQPKRLPTSGECLPFEDMERLVLRFTSATDRPDQVVISDYDQDMATCIVERLCLATALSNEFIYEHMQGTERYYLDVDGRTPRARDPTRDPSKLYKMLPLRMIPIVGDYYRILRQRPGKQSDTFEYMPNASYAYRHVKRDLAQLKVEVFPSRMWHENPTSAIVDEQLHPYIAWFPCNSFQFEEAETALGIYHIPFGNEVVWRASNPTASGKPRLIVDNLGTVQRLVDLGLITSASKTNLLSYKALLDQQIELAEAEKEKNPFALAIKPFGTHINRWKRMSKALGAVANPHSAYGPRVNDLPDEVDDRKRKAGPESLASSSPSITHDEDEDGNPQPQQPADNNMDRQNPEGSGGNPT